jgi:hypothetical protein
VKLTLKNVKYQVKLNFWKILLKIFVHILWFENVNQDNDGQNILAFENNVDILFKYLTTQIQLQRAEFSNLNWQKLLQSDSPVS